jgi:hypothetical protein
MFKANRSHVTLRPGHEDFSFSPDGITVVPRACIEISQRCPENYRDLISECIGHGWIKVVANMRDTEYTMELLKK